MTAIFISDLHLGSPVCDAESLCIFLESLDRSRTLWLVGDVFDDATFSVLPAAHLRAAELILSFDDVRWLPGNHDHIMRKVVGLESKIKIVDEAVYIAHDGKRYLVTHGHRYDWTLWLTPPVWLRKLVMRYTKTGLHGRITHEKQKRCAVREAKKRGYDGVICGHSHMPEVSTLNDICYVNCGDWIKHCTAVFDDLHGIRLWRYR